MKLDRNEIDDLEVEALLHSHEFCTNVCLQNIKTKHTTKYALIYLYVYSRVNKFKMENEEKETWVAGVENPPLWSRTHFVVSVCTNKSTDTRRPGNGT